MRIRDRIRDNLMTALEPVALEIIDDSARHAGHAGASLEGETHFFVRIVSAKFLGLKRPARHRLVYDALKREFADGMHALNIQALAPDEA